MKKILVALFMVFGTSLIGGVIILGLIYSAVAKDESNKAVAFVNTGVNPAVPEGLTEFSYFCWYESGGEGLYDAVLGDGGSAFGAYQYDYRYELQPFLNYCIQQDADTYRPFNAFTSVPKNTLKGNTDLAATWHMVYAANPEAFSRIQDKYVKKEKYIPVESFHKARGLDLSGRPDVIKGLVLSIHNRKGMETTTSLSYIVKSGVTNDTSDEDFITKVCDAFGNRGGNIKQRYCVDGSGAALNGLCEKNMALAILRARNAMVASGAVGGTYNTGGLQIPIIYQTDYPHVAYGGGTMVTSGCGIASFAMVASYKLGTLLTPDVIVAWCGNSYYVAGAGSSWALFPGANEHYKLGYSVRATGSAVEAYKAMQAGKPVISSQSSGLFTNGGHFIVLRGLTSDGKVLVNDPNKTNAITKGYNNRAFDFNREVANTSKQYWIFE